MHCLTTKRIRHKILLSSVVVLGLMWVQPLLAQSNAAEKVLERMDHDGCAALESGPKSAALTIRSTAKRWKPSHLSQPVRGHSPGC